nr:MAG TPA: hypothetical protein [Caudoviricetes sp.]
MVVQTAFSPSVGAIAPLSRCFISTCSPCCLSDLRASAPSAATCNLM